MALHKCQEALAVSKVKVEEGRRKAVFCNANRDPFLKTKVDGCLITSATASDWVVSKPGVGDVVVELKGVDVNHAAKQVLSTAEYWRGSSLHHGKLAGLIVCAEYPRFNTKIQRAQQAFSRAHSGPLHVVTSNREYVFEHVLSYKGPFAA